MTKPASRSTSGPSRPAGSRALRADSVYVRIDRRAPQPLQVQIAEGLRAAVGDGRLAPGTRLPGSRSLAVALAVSRTTVALAIDALVVEGFAVARARSGVFVADQPPQASALIVPPRGAPAAGVASTRAEGAALRLSRGARAAQRKIAAHAATPRPVAFALARPALDLFPIEVWNRLMAPRAACAWCPRRCWWSAAASARSSSPPPRCSRRATA